MPAVGARQHVVFFQGNHRLTRKDEGGEVYGGLERVDFHSNYEEEWWTIRKAKDSEKGIDKHISIRLYITSASV
jgi:hypothetical protein